MSSPVRLPDDSGTSVAAFAVSELEYRVDLSVVHHGNRVTAFRFEFVARREQAANAVWDLAAAIPSELADFAGFAGSLVMVSDLEARLDHRHHHLARKPSARDLCRERAKRAGAACALLGPLRAGTTVAGAPADAR